MSRGHTSGRAAAFVAAGLVTVSIGCSDYSTDAPTAPDPAPSFGVLPQQALDAVMRAQERHTAALLARPGVVGTAVTRLANGAPAVRVFVENAGVAGVPATLDGFPVSRVVSGKFWIISDPTTKARPAPLGFSVGHPDITAGSIGLRVKDATGNVYILSNNHVLANSNDADIGDPTLQPGPFDGGTSADQVGTLADFQPINFGSSNNTMDAAIAEVASADLLGSTPADDGYGAPSSQIWGDGDNDGMFDDVGDLVNVQVMKYGRTTEFTEGPITSVNATVTVCYASSRRFCTLFATFTDQLIVGESGFSAGGDSGAGVVTVDGKNPVGLLFAGSTTQTILNRIDFVLERFGVTVDPGSDPPDPDPVTDLAVDAVSTASPATEGITQNVTVTVRNVGNQTVTTDFNVELRDGTVGVTVGNQLVTSDLAAGGSVPVVFSWTPQGPTGVDHTLTGEHFLSDDDPDNDTKSTTVLVNAAGGGGGATMHVADLSGSSVRSGTTWTATAVITIRDDQNNLVSNATVSANWTSGTPSSGSCTTDGSGTCSISADGLSRTTGSTTFTVTNVTHATLTYDASANIASSLSISRPQ